jgi:hypothetical protein
MNFKLFGYKLGKRASILLKPGIPRLRMHTAKQFVSREILKPKLLEQFKREQVPKIRISNPL